MILGITGRLEDYMRRRWTDQLKITARLVMRELLKVLWVFPVNKRKILFESFNGASYSCNPKYLSEYLELHCPGEYELIWSLSHPESFPEVSEHPGVHVVRKRSFRWYYDYLTAGVRISNSNNQLISFPRRENQLVINTWHAGGAYKKTGTDAEHVLEKQDAFHQWRRNSQAEQYNLFLSSSPVFTKTNIRGAFHYDGSVLKSGQPRNDLFFDPARVREASAAVRRSLGISGIVVLYAPTYRGDFHRASETPLPPFREIAEGVQKRFGCAPTILFRAHHADRNSLSERDFPNPDAHQAQLIDVSCYPDMQELLCAADILITDYSSSIWDYALLGRPCFLYVPDLEDYTSGDRGFFTPIDCWPGVLCRDAQALYRELCALDEDACRSRAEAHLILFQSYECGKACEITMQAIRHFIRTGKPC